MNKACYINYDLFTFVISGQLFENYGLHRVEGLRLAPCVSYFVFLLFELFS